jgi:hypothetical protein
MRQPVFSRTLVILLCFGVGLYRATEGAWIAAAGLFALGGGLILLQAARARHQPGLKRLAWVAFSFTAIAVVIVFLRGR